MSKLIFPKHGGAQNSEDLAKAEQIASENDWIFAWEYDSEPYEAGGGISDPSNEHRRVVEAELAAEALAR